MTQLKPIDGTTVYLWKYLPSIPLAAIAIILFALTTSAHSYRVFKSRSWFCIPFLIGGLCSSKPLGPSLQPFKKYEESLLTKPLLLVQIIGYALRILSHYTTNQIAPYVTQSCLILLAPVLYAATIYMALGRIIVRVHGEHFSIIQPSRMTKLFVLGDVLSLTIQGNAAGLTGKKKTQVIGQWIVTAGLFIQLIIFGFFVIAAVAWHRRMRRYMAESDEGRRGRKMEAGRWEIALKVLYSCSALIIVRSIFRVVEYIMGIDGYLLSHEWPMYVFDGLLMLFVQVVFLAGFPYDIQSEGQANGEDGCELVGNMRVGP